jgi:hypothetical protein
VVSVFNKEFDGGINDFSPSFPHKVRIFDLGRDLSLGNRSLYFFDSSQTTTPFSFMAGIRTGLERALSHSFFLAFIPSLVKNLSKELI